MKIKTQLLKIYGTQKEIHSSTGLPQETRKISNKQSKLIPKGTRKLSTNKDKHFNRYTVVSQDGFNLHFTKGTQCKSDWSVSLIHLLLNLFHMIP